MTCYVFFPECCHLCNKEKAAFSGLEYRQTGNVDLNEVSPYAKDGDFLEVTQWTNKDGIDIHIERLGKETNVSMTYDELNAILNIVNKFDGFFPIIYDEDNKFHKKLSDL